MRVKWENIFGFMLFLVLLILLLNSGPILLYVMSIPQLIQSDDPATGLLALGMFGVIIVAIVKILTHADRGD